MVFRLVVMVAFWNSANAQTIQVSGGNPSAPTISKFIYSHFAEHLGRCIYDGFYVGESSSISNTNGIRNDVVEALKKMKIPPILIS